MAYYCTQKGIAMAADTNPTAVTDGDETTWYLVVPWGPDGGPVVINSDDAIGYLAMHPEVASMNPIEAATHLHQFVMDISIVTSGSAELEKLVQAGIVIGDGVTAEDRNLVRLFAPNMYERPPEYDP